MATMLTPESFDAVGAALAEASAGGTAVRIAGGGTKGRWGAPARRENQQLLSTRGLDQIYSHDAAAATAVVGAGVKLERLQGELAGSGQMLALDPPMGDNATIGGIFATGDCGPLRHRYGTPRDQVLGMTVALADGSVARSGAAVLRNTAGYDLARLFCGSYGTLGVILSVSVRLVPLPPRTATALALAPDPASLVAAVTALGHAPLDLLALDVAWRNGRGGLLARAGGRDAARRAARAAALMSEAGLGGAEVSTRDNALWARQRSGQRSADQALMRIVTRPSQLGTLLAIADAADATVVGRAALGISYLELAPHRVAGLRAALPRGVTAELLDRPDGAPPAASWPEPDGSVLALMRAVKARFDPSQVCNPGIYVGGI